jgi:hypothetical protein
MRSEEIEFGDKSKPRGEGRTSYEIGRDRVWR